MGDSDRAYGDCPVRYIEYEEEKRMSSKMKERLHTGEIYYPNDDEIVQEQFQCQEKMYDYNSTRPSEGEKRTKLLKEMFAEIGENCYIEPPLRANWGGHFVHFGKNIYANFNLTLVDDTVIGAGSIVTKDIPANVVAVGNPCRVMREISEHDREYYFKDRKIDYENL